jgi:BTB/POZ domain-containing protein KCTD9
LSVQRLDYEASCRRLHELGFPECDPAPPMLDRKPRHDDEEPLGVSLLRLRVEGDLSGLTLPRTYFGRSEIEAASFRGTDLTESSMCWNDIIDVQFDEASLAGADLRESIFERVSFVEANLDSADLRRSSFVGCSFERASMRGTTLTREQGQSLSLSPAQRAKINWADDDGEEPEGG